MIKIVLEVNLILNLAEEFLKKIKLKVLHECWKKKGLGRGLSALFGDTKPKRKSSRNTNQNNILAIVI